MPGWSEEDVLAHGRQFLSDQAAERQRRAVANLLKDNFSPCKPEPDLLTMARGLVESLGVFSHEDWCNSVQPIHQDGPCNCTATAVELNDPRPKVRKPRAHPERDLEKACSDLLQYDGWRLLKTDPVSDRNRGKGFGEIGMADCLYIRYSRYLEDCGPNCVPCCAPCEVIWIEYKAPGGKPSRDQRAWIASETARGALVWLAGANFPASVDGFLAHYRGSGLMRRKL